MQESAPLREDEVRRIEAFASGLEGLRGELHRRIVGQEEVITQILTAIIAEGHCLLVGLPGLAKTLLISSIAELLSLDFKRIQFTPDLMPSDITGASILGDDGSGHRSFQYLKGPIFANVILADEINRTPPKTQSALMEAMEERQVTGGGQRFRLDRPFFVLATQNPIELEGTYPLPVSQLDRFLFSIAIDYPTSEEEFRILLLTTSTYKSQLPKVLSREEVIEMIQLARRISIEPRLLDYAARIVRSTRPAIAGASSLATEMVAWGGGPRATQAILSASRAMALLAGRSEVRADDIHAVVVPTLRHRIVLRYHAEAEGARTDEVILKTLAAMPDGLYRPPPEAPSAVKDRAAKRSFLSRLLRSSR